MNVHSRYVLRYISDIPLLICATVPIKDCWMFEVNELGALIWQQFEKKSNIEDKIKNIENKMKTKLDNEQKNIIKSYCDKLEEIGVVKDGVWV